MPTTPVDEKVLLPKEDEAHSRSFKNVCACEDYSNADVSADMHAIQMPLLNPEKRVETSFLNPEKRVESPYARVFTPASARVPLVKSLAHRKLRKYASETCFSLEATSCTDLLPKNSEEKEMQTTTGKHKVFSVRPVKSIAYGMVLRDGTVHGQQHTRREDSEGDVSCSGSDATVASNSMTPILRHKTRRFRLNRPKSATQMSGTPISSDAYNTLTSGTVRSIDSLQQIGFGVTGSNDGRRNSSAYNLDDDSLHEFDDEKGNTFYS